MKHGEIYPDDLDPTARHEQRGHCPMGVVSTGHFNQLAAHLAALLSNRRHDLRRRPYSCTE